MLPVQNYSFQKGLQHNCDKNKIPRSELILPRFAGVLPVFIVCYGIAKCIREITRGSVMCRYLMTNDLIYDWMK